MYSGQSVVDVYTVVEVVVYVRGSKSDVVGKHSIIVLIEICTLECRSVLVVALLTCGIIVTLTAKGFGSGESQRNGAFVHLGLELNVLAKLKLEAVASEQHLEDVRHATACAKVNVGVEIEVDVVLVDLKVDNVDIKHLAAGQLVSGIIGVERMVDNTKSDLNGNKRSKLGRGNGECAGGAYDLRFRGENSVALNKREYGIGISGIPESKNGYRYVAVICNRAL